MTRFTRGKLIGSCAALSAAGLGSAAEASLALPVSVNDKGKPGIHYSL